jgi:acetyl esterase
VTTERESPSSGTPTRKRATAPLHPQVEALRRKRIASGTRPLYELTVAEARRAELADGGPTAAAAIDRLIPGPGGDLRLRIYLPEHSSAPPVLAYFVGGGWVHGSIEASAAVCRRLARTTPCAVATVAYRLAPEHPFPAAVEDCYAATRWLADHAGELGLDAARIAVGGGSAGANLAAATTLLARERGGPPLAFQLLVYPPTDYRADTASRRTCTDPVFFDRRSVEWCWSHYLADEAEGDDPLASPLRAPDVRGLPPALVITAELDPLRDEAELYATKLAAAGVPTEVVRYPGMVHGFFSMTDQLDAAQQAQDLAAAALRRAFSR